MCWENELIFIRRIFNLTQTTYSKILAIRITSIIVTAGIYMIVKFMFHTIFFHVLIFKICAYNNPCFLEHLKIITPYL